MSEHENVKKYRPKYEHIALTAASTQKINGWIAQVSDKKKGVDISRKGLVNWLIEKMPDSLSGGDLNSIVERFYSEEKFLRQLLKEVQSAKLAGNDEPDFELVVKPRKTEKITSEPDTK